MGPACNRNGVCPTRIGLLSVQNHNQDIHRHRCCQVLLVAAAGEEGSDAATRGGGADLGARRFCVCCAVPRPQDPQYNCVFRLLPDPSQKSNSFEYDDESVSPAGSFRQMPGLSRGVSERSACSWTSAAAISYPTTVPEGDALQSPRQ
eukprot:830563-Prymnesium_polylepis.1